MGFADVLYRLGIKYDSEEGLKKAGKIMSFINDTAKECSRELGKEKGSFPFKNKSIYKEEKHFRNSNYTVLAPTGSLSMVASCSGGIEPNFGLAFIKTVVDGIEFKELNPYLVQALKDNNIYTEELINEIIKIGSIKDIKKIPKEIRDVFVVAQEISPEYHIKMQAEFQKFTTNAISKTVNFPQEATKEDVEKAYMLAYSLFCKGVTVYRDGSRPNQVLTLGTKKEEPIS